MADDFTFTFQFVDAKETIALATALPAVCIVVVGLRFFTRRLQHVEIGIDDWLAVCGLVGLHSILGWMADSSEQWIDWMMYRSR